MACEPIPGCEDCTGTSEALTCEKAIALRCRLLSQLELLACSPIGPISIEGLKYESKSEAMRVLKEMIDWTYELCARTEDDGVAIEYSSSIQCGDQRCYWWSTEYC